MEAGLLGSAPRHPGQDWPLYVELAPYDSDEDGLIYFCSIFWVSERVIL